MLFHPDDIDSWADWHDQQTHLATVAEAHAEWHANAGVPMGAGGGVCPWDACGWAEEPDPDCLEHDDPNDCDGPVQYRAALSGSGLSYPRCTTGYEQYVARVQPEIDAINERYPDTDSAPEWFDPSYAGESWNPID